jgi:hypothetical protein
MYIIIYESLFHEGIKSVKNLPFVENEDQQNYRLATIPGRQLLAPLR